MDLKYRTIDLLEYYISHEDDEILLMYDDTLLVKLAELLFLKKMD